MYVVHIYVVEESFCRCLNTSFSRATGFTVRTAVKILWIGCGQFIMFTSDLYYRYTSFTTFPEFVVTNYDGNELKYLFVDIAVMQRLIFLITVHTPSVLYSQ